MTISCQKVDLHCTFCHTYLESLGISFPLVNLVFLDLRDDRLSDDCPELMWIPLSTDGLLTSFWLELPPRYWLVGESHKSGLGAEYNILLPENIVFSKFNPQMSSRFRVLYLWVSLLKKQGKNNFFLFYKYILQNYSRDY